MASTSARTVRRGKGPRRSRLRHRVGARGTAGGDTPKFHREFRRPRLIAGIRRSTSESSPAARTSAILARQYPKRGGLDHETRTGRTTADTDARGNGKRWSLIESEVVACSGRLDGALGAMCMALNNGMTATVCVDVLSAASHRRDTQGDVSGCDTPPGSGGAVRTQLENGFLGVCRSGIKARPIRTRGYRSRFNPRRLRFRFLLRSSSALPRNRLLNSGVLASAISNV